MKPPKKIRTKIPDLRGQWLDPCLGKVYFQLQRGFGYLCLVGEISMGTSLGCPRKLVNGYI